MATLELSAAAICDFVEVYTGVTTAGDALKYVNAGYERFLSGLDPRTGRAHAWSFLQPMTTITLTVAGVGTYALPADFGGLIEKFVYRYSSTLTNEMTVESSPDTIYAAWRDDNVAGVPKYWAIVPITLTPATGQLWNLIVYPIPEVERTWQYRYLQLATVLTDAAVYLLGGAYYSYTIRALALAEAELLLGHTTGIHEGRANTLMAAAIDRDKQLFTTHDVENIIGGP